MRPGPARQSRRTAQITRRHRGMVPDRQKRRGISPGQAAVLEALRHGGRFVMRNLCPQECPDWLYYEYFPQAHTIDLEDFWPPETILTTMEATGFARVTVELEHLRFAQDLCVWLDAVRRRDSNLYGDFPVKWCFRFIASSLFGAGRAVLRPVACDQVPGARGRGQGTETLAKLGGLPLSDACVSQRLDA